MTATKPQKKTAAKKTPAKKTTKAVEKKNRNCRSCYRNRS